MMGNCAGDCEEDGGGGEVGYAFRRGLRLKKECKREKHRGRKTKRQGRGNRGRGREGGRGAKEEESGENVCFIYYSIQRWTLS